MVREVVTHPRAVHHGIDPDRAQMLGRPYAGQLQQLGRAVSARTEDDFISRRRSAGPPAAFVFHADRRAVADDDAAHQRASHQREIW